MKKILIANRGEIAVRIARACADYGAASVAVYADADFDALHVRMADEAYALHGERSVDTYLNIGKLLEVARRSGADAVHPGYGFLSENAAFARAVMDAGLIWIGPPPAAIEQLGDKVQARKLAMQVGAPLVHGTSDPVRDAGEVLAFAREHGLPVAIKAAFGGGGRGLKVARKLEEIEELYASAVREALAAFGRGECFVEQFLDRPRHVEAQVLADQHGNVVVVGTRDCSLQRRNQKLVEEAPAPFLSEAQRERIHRAARDICLAASYVGAGTVEFLLSANGAISFLEVNTRLQVEHPVTEETTGVDLVLEQLRIADGAALSLKETPVPRGHAFEFRINAEDVGRGFLPCPGPVQRFDPPSGPGVRVDSGVTAGSVVSGHFDSLLAKLIVTGATRDEAIARARRALAEFRIDGLATVLPFHRAVMAHEDFTVAVPFRVHTRWIETDFANTLPAQAPGRETPAPALQRLDIEWEGRRVALGLPIQLLQSLVGGRVVVEGGGQPGMAPAAANAVNGVNDVNAAKATGQAPAVLAPIAGILQRWKVEDGAQVEEGQLLAIMEAMKMEMSIVAPRAGRIEQLAAEGSQLAAAAALADIT
ncbi:acetyl/propionyl/methylcrotonyl-CoA carboxylase subunit alpha [Kerstersia similis]|uniref:acetyl/propionyl/methylcrotonyl-CoA carboxylase subunit alpha n=1 Tax=Kerstersia similis TaxID=206505 RepID=UPI0039EE41C5